MNGKGFFDVVDRLDEVSRFPKIPQVGASFATNLRQVLVLNEKNMVTNKLIAEH